MPGISNQRDGGKRVTKQRPTERAGDVLESLDEAIGGHPGSVTVDGCVVRYRHLALTGGPRMLLVHGGAAHGGWWVDVVPGLAERYDLVVPDLSGHGDSGQRDRYEPEAWADELAAVISALGSDPVLVVGHSIGGRTAAYLAARWPRLVAGLVMIDTSLRLPGPDGWKRSDKVRRPKKPHPTVESALARFRLEPPETTADSELLRRVGRLSLERVPEGFTWRFDPNALRRFTDAGVYQEMDRVQCPVGLIHGALSPLVGPETVSYLRQALPGDPHIPYRVVPNAYHHVPLDEPQQCRIAIEDVLGRLG